MNNDKAMLLVHTVFKGEGWQDTADKIIIMINSAGKKSPGRSAVMAAAWLPGALDLKYPPRSSLQWT